MIHSRTHFEFFVFVLRDEVVDAAELIIFTLRDSSPKVSYFNDPNADMAVGSAKRLIKSVVLKIIPLTDPWTVKILWVLSIDVTVEVANDET